VCFRSPAMTNTRSGCQRIGGVCNYTLKAAPEYRGRPGSRSALAAPEGTKSYETSTIMHPPSLAPPVQHGGGQRITHRSGPVNT